VVTSSSSSPFGAAPGALGAGPAPAAPAAPSAAEPRRGPGSAYSRFIPREELRGFAAWTPGDLGASPPAAAPGVAPPPPPEPPPPTPEEWRARIAAARQAGYEDGWRDGHAALEGFKRSHEAQVASQIGGLVRAFDERFEAIEAEIAGAVTDSTVALAMQVVRQQLALAPGLVAGVAAEAVNALLRGARQVSVHVHPADAPLVEAGAGDVLSARGAHLVRDPEVARGGVFVRSDMGAVDATIAARWAQAVASLGRAVPWSAGEALAATKPFAEAPRAAPAEATDGSA
jgi:flagellar assembly protein FliH